MRTEWIAKRKDHTNRSQMHYARQGIITEEMDYVARREKPARRADSRRSSPRADDHPRQHQPPQPGAHVHWHCV